MAPARRIPRHQVTPDPHMSTKTTIPDHYKKWAKEEAHKVIDADIKLSLVGAGWSERKQMERAYEAALLRMWPVVDALQPFARFAAQWERMPVDGKMPDDGALYSIHGTTEWGAEITLGHVKDAMGTLSSLNLPQPE